MTRALQSTPFQNPGGFRTNVTESRRGQAWFLIGCQYVSMSVCQCVSMSVCHYVSMSVCQYVIMSVRQPDYLIVPPAAATDGAEESEEAVVEDLSGRDEAEAHAETQQPTARWQ